MCLNQYNTDIFSEDLKCLGISVTEKQLGQFLKYYEMLVEWNQVMNLTAITEYGDVMKKHFVDSISLVKAYEPARSISVMDVGTGAGFPGLPLKIIFPEIQLTLLDSLKKRIQFLDAVVEKLDFKDVKTIHGRAEDFAREGRLRETFDLCVSRAVANLSTLSEYCIPFVKQGGAFISYKTENGIEEIKAAEGAIAVLGGRIERLVEFALPNSDIHRTLVLIRKEKDTPAKYPRKAGVPGKEPL